MTPPNTAYISAAQNVSGAEQSQMFGKPCFKVSGKAFVAYFQDAMVFKLTGDSHANALALEGAQLFDPSGKGRAMREWVQVPLTHKTMWPALAIAAAAYVMG